MAHALIATHALAQQWRAHGPALLAGAPDPHTDLLTLVWGPRFDRTHALELVLRHAPSSTHTLAVLLVAAEQFDALSRAAQQRLRRLIVRHRDRHLQLQVGAHDTHHTHAAADGARIPPHAPCPAD